MRFSVTATILHLVIGFIPKISFVSPSSCYSSLGRTGKKQQISLAEKVNTRVKHVKVS